MREVVICLGSSLPKSIRRRVFLACYNNRHVLWHVQVAVFQCAIAVIDQCVMTPKEVELMLFITSGSIENSPRGGKRFQVLLLDLLRRRLICERLKKMSTGSEINFCKTARVHNKLAREVLSLEKFPVDLEDFDCSKSSAWQCGSTVLTLRIGSKRSLYRGWVEITVRSPSFRFRRLVRWKTENFTENAEILLPFWEQLHTSLENSAAKQPVSHPAKSFEESLDLIESQHDLIDRHDPSQRNDTKSLSNARSIIDRFDQLFDASSVTGSSESEKLNFSSLRSQTEVFSSLRTSNLRHETSDISSDRRSEFGFNPKALKRTLSDGNISESMRLSTHSEQKQKRERNLDCVYSWLKNAVGNPSCDKEIILEFEALGFSSTALGFPLIPSNASMPTSYPSLYSHDVLTPYANGSNFLRSISILDRKTPFQDHKIALFYGGPFSTKKSKKPDSSANDGNHFLMATQASTDFWEFAKDLGDFVPVRHLKYFSGGLDTSKSLADGSFAIVWFGSQCEDDDAPIAIDSMVIFHTITLMPDGVINRKRHVGNDMVHVVYGIEIDVDHENLAIGHFGFVTIYIIPLGKTDMVKISVRLKSGLDETICMALDHVVQDVVSMLLMICI